MMNKIVSTLLCIFFLFTAIPVAGAETVTTTDSSYTEYLPDGSHYVTELHIDSCRTDSGMIGRSSTSGKKESVYYNAFGEKQWSMKLTGTFTYNGVTSACTAASVSYTIYNSAWQYQSKSASANGNAANGSLTMIKKLLGITVQTETKSLTIVCDKNGNLS